jgi:hypothetical protein
VYRHYFLQRYYNILFTSFFTAISLASAASLNHMLRTLRSFAYFCLLVLPAQSIMYNDSKVTKWCQLIFTASRATLYSIEFITIYSLQKFITKCFGRGNCSILFRCYISSFDAHVHSKTRHAANTQQKRMQPTNSNTYAHRGDIINNKQQHKTAVSSSHNFDT